ncbi:hypothetical protein RvY_06889 [Ramazzottius varieornatus]|uniref:Uncharacterized protein n=1 Tax=Ramazzottius varieornatus TaxID=947166 RepID=A0A1D1V2Y8_RAMVA|nr:hypothetical protein RvY_06889 [Ramazzottius varieornatus]
MDTRPYFLHLIFLGLVTLHGTNGQFPAYFFSQSASNSPPNCVCRQGGTVNNPNQISNGNVNNQQPNNQFPNGQFSNNQFPNGQFPYSQFPNGQFPSGINPLPINDFPNGRLPEISANQPGFNLPGGSDRRPGRRHFSPTGFPSSLRICGSDGMTYSDVCLIINAQYSNPSLGGRPCDLQSAVQIAQQAQNTNGNTLTTPVCMNDGSNAQSATAALQLMLNNPRLGIRCQGSCPCTLSCPPTVGNTQVTSHHGDCFNHWSFYQGSRRPQQSQNSGRPGHGRPFRGQG